MKSIKPKSPVGELKEGFDISIAQYREITEVPGYKLRKPIEVALLEKKDRGGGVGYFAIHRLPSFLDRPEGSEIKGEGSTEDEAAKDLSRQLVSIFKYLTGLSENGDLKFGLITQKKYLETILISE